MSTLPNRVIIIFIISGVGFDFAFLLLPGRSCDRNILVSSPQIFASDNFPFNYTERLYCRYTFVTFSSQSQFVLCFQFKKFQLLQSDYCQDDYLEFDGVGRFCGNGWLDGNQSSNVNILQPFCITPRAIDKYVVVFNSVDYSTHSGFYSNFNFFPHKNINVCNGDTQFRCFGGDSECEYKSDACHHSRCRDGSGDSLFYAGCERPGRRSIEMCSYEDGLCLSPIQISNWELTPIYATPPYDHTTLSDAGHVMKTTGDVAVLQYESQLSYGASVAYGAYGSPGLLCLSFWYFMHGPVRNFTVHVRKYSSGVELGKAVWKRFGNRGYAWSQGEIGLDYSLASNSLVSFVAYSSEGASVSIDDISIIPHECHGDDISCTFELGPCGWTLHQGVLAYGTPRYFISQRVEPDSEPSSNSTHFVKVSSSGGHDSIKVSSSGGHDSVKTVMSSGPANLMTPAACLFFSYSSFGPRGGNATLALKGLNSFGSDFLLWSVTVAMETDATWKSAEVTFQFDGLVEFAFEVEFNGKEGMVVSIDDVYLTFQGCQQVETTTTTTALYCPTGLFECRESLECLPPESLCNVSVECQDASDEFNCPKTGGPLKYYESPVRSSIIVTFSVIGGTLVLSVIATIFFIIVRRQLRSRNNRPRLNRLGNDQIDHHGDFPKPPPYSLHPPPYSTQSPPYSSAEQLNPKEYDVPPPRYSESTDGESPV